MSDENKGEMAEGFNPDLAGGENPPEQSEKAEQPEKVVPRKAAQIVLEYATSPEGNEDGDWTAHHAFWIGGDASAKEDRKWIHKILSYFINSRAEHPALWWRVVIKTEGTTITTSDGGTINVGGGGTFVVLGPDKHDEKVTFVPVDDDTGYFILPVNLPGISAFHKEGFDDLDGAPGKSSGAGEEVVEDQEGVDNTVTLTDEDGEIVSTSTVESNTPIASGTEIKAVDELGREYTVTVV